MAALSVLLVAVLVIVLFCGTLLRVEIAGLIIALFVGCMLSLIGSLVFFIWDVNLSLQGALVGFPGWSSRRSVTQASRIFWNGPDGKKSRY